MLSNPDITVADVADRLGVSPATLYRYLPAVWTAHGRPGSGLWEVRSSWPSRCEARVLFGCHDGMLIALTAFIKKTQATPAGEIALAQQRLKEATTS